MADAKINVGTRDSQLALIQTNFIVSKLKEKNPNHTMELVSMKTIGDQVLHKALPKIGETNLFTKELETALAQRKVDFIVHSLKDLPSTLPPNMAIGAIYRRDSPHDAVILHPKNKGLTIEKLPAGSVIGTSSLRRIAQLLRKYPHLKFQDIRGNLNTRLKKLEEGDVYDAIILAKAGLDRMNWQDKTDQVLLEDVCLYAVGQGALAVELNIDDKKTTELIAELNDFETLLCCAAERAFLKTLQGGCSVPVGVDTQFKDNKLSMTGAVLSLDGKDCINNAMVRDIPPINDKVKGRDPTLGVSSILIPAHMYDAVHEGEMLGEKLGLELIASGAEKILEKARQDNEAST